MIVPITYELQLQKSYDKILHIYPALKSTFAFLACRNHCRDIFGHCNKKGKILFEMTFDDPTVALALINDHEAVILQTRQNAILVIDLNNYSTWKLPFLFML